MISAERQKHRAFCYELLNIGCYLTFAGMGTKIQSNRYLAGYCSFWGLNESVNNDILSIYNDGKALKNGQHYDPILPQKLRMGVDLGYDKEKVRQMILEHESTFRHQLQELHRLYGRQREIMNEFKRKVTNGQMEPQTSHSSGFPPHISSDDSRPTWHVSHTSLLRSLLDQASGIQNSSLPSFRKGETMLGPFPSRDEGSSEKCEPPNSNSKLLQSRVFDLEMPADVNMNDEGKKLEKNFCGLPVIESVSTTRIDEILHNKDVYHHQNGDALWSNLCFKGKSQLADLNEPIPLEENSVSAIVENSGNVTSCSTDIGQEQLRTDFRATIMSNDAHPSVRDACSKDSQPELRRDEFSTSDQGVAKRQMKRKLFGVDISEVDDKLLGTDPSMANCNLANCNLTSDKRSKDLLPRLASFEGSACLNWKSAKVSKTANKLSNAIQDVVVSEHNIVNADCPSEQNDSKGSLLTCTGTKYCGQQTRTNKNSHHLNLDSLQYSCQQFFQKSRGISLSSQIMIQKQEIPSAHLAQETEQRNTAVDGGSNAEMANRFSVSNPKELSFAGISSKAIYLGADSNNSGHMLVEKPNSKDEPKAGDLVLEERINSSLSGLRRHIDLNLSLIEDEAPPAPPLPSTIVKIVRTEIDLEAPIVLQAEADRETNLSPDELKEPYDEELVKIAAEAMFAISSSSAQNTLNVATAEPLETAASGHLSWFAELACSYECDDWSNASELTVDGVITEEMIPQGIDYFEFMTLRLKDTKEDNYHYRPLIMENENEGGEETKVAIQSRRPRRGQARKGRQRKDFQRDILPALVTLSKREMVEDFQTLEELSKSSGCEWQSNLVRKAAGKSSRRRKSLNSGVSTPPRESDAICYSPEQQPASTDMQVEEKTLSGWGKRIRRLPRQRYMNGSHTFQLKP